jgi:hypothetical protein
MRLDRLWQVAKHLETIPNAEFDLENWKRDYECGTVACAIGHACKIFPELKLVKDYRFGEYDLDTSYDLEYNGYHGFSAVSNFFGITVKEGLNLFSNGNYPEIYSKQMVIDRIKKFVIDKMYDSNFILKLILPEDPQNELYNMWKRTVPR